MLGIIIGFIIGLLIIQGGIKTIKKKHIGHEKGNYAYSPGLAPITGKPAIFFGVIFILIGLFCVLLMILVLLKQRGIFPG